MAKRARSVKGWARAALKADSRARTMFRAPLPDLTEAYLVRDGRDKLVRTVDSFQNFFAALGIGTDNLSTFAQYGFNPVTRNHIQLEWMHRGSWLAGVAVDLVAEDMTRAGVELLGEIEPEDVAKLEAEATRIALWDTIAQWIKWARLYGGAILVPLIDGQDPKTPLILEEGKTRIGKNQFKGVLPFDRWMVEPELNRRVQELGPALGLPSSYLVTAQAPALSGLRIHHTRAFRQIGIKLPWWQELTENLWGISVLERLFDRMTAYDAASQGASQLVYKAHLRTYSVKGLREIIASAGPAFDGLVKMVDMFRRMQTNEGITLIDGEDKVENFTQTAFSGLSDALLQFGQQLAGALQIPLVRLFGQSPAGLNSTGESDLRMYYDGIRQRQISTLQVPVTTFYRLMASSLGIALPEDFAVNFKPLWQLTDKEKSDIAKVNTETVLSATEAGLTSPQTALKELKQQARVTGIWSNVTDEDINAAEETPAPMGANAPEEGGEEGGGKEKGEGTPTGALDSQVFKPRWTKQEVHYEHPAKGPDHCGKCHFFVSTGACLIVKGQIRPEDWCEQFEKRITVTIDHNSKVAQFAWRHGLQVVVETPQGTVRRGYGWTTTMPADYGYVRMATGADGDQLDCYLGPAPESERVFVINQRSLENGGAFDEHKVMLGYYAKETAVEDYVLGYTDGSGPKRMMDVVEMGMGTFKKWMSSGDLSRPAVIQ